MCKVLLCNFFSYAYPCGPTGVCNCQQEVADCRDAGLTSIPRFTNADVGGQIRGKKEGGKN